MAPTGCRGHLGVSGGVGVSGVIGGSRNSWYSDQKGYRGHQGLLVGVGGYLGASGGVRGVLGLAGNSQYSGTRRSIGA